MASKSSSYGGKKRARTFTGSRHTPTARPSVEEQPAEERPVTASSKKLKVVPPPSTSFTSGVSGVLLRPRPTMDGGGEASRSETETGNLELSGNRLISCSSIVSLASQLKCPKCRSSLSVSEDFGSRRGLITRIKVQCSTDCGWFHYLSDSYNTSMNTQSVLAARTVGMSQTSLTTFCGMMDLPPPTCKKSYANSNKLILSASKKAVREEQLAAATELHALFAAGILYDPPALVEADSSEDEQVEDEDECATDGCLGSDLSDDDDDTQSRRPGGEPIDVTVTYDGTWSKRGFTALYGVGVVLSLDTGRALDSQVMCRYCGPCALHNAELTPQEFQDWYETHKACCQLNHSKSSTSMEVAAALILWKRSESRLNLRYVNVVSDGDSKTMKALRKKKPYGEDVKLTKYECVGHVQKRLGRAIIDLRTKPPMETVTVTHPAVRARRATKKKPAVKASPEFNETVIKKVQVGDAGGITKSNYLVLQQHYGNAIRQHAGDLEGMVEACWAVYYHSISTDDNPQHHSCPMGEISWCSYQRAMAFSQEVPHHRDLKDPKRLIPPRLAKHIKPIFERLCNRSLLERCVMGATQNQNESFNSVVWLRCSKTDFSSPATVKLAVNLAVLTFNRGMSSLTSVLGRLGIQLGPLGLRCLESKDADRIQRAASKASDVAKRIRQSKERRRAEQEERMVAREGVTYQAGGF